VSSNSPVLTGDQERLKTGGQKIRSVLLQRETWARHPGGPEATLTVLLTVILLAAELLFEGG
jgi:hypothetical protein